MSEFRVSVSNSVSKLGKFIGSFNLPAGVTCNPDAPCFKGCYAMKGRFQFSAVKNCYEQNLMAYRSDPKRFWQTLIVESGMYKYFRWFSSGDIVDADFLKGMVLVAKRNPDTKYLAFTKQFGIANEYLEHHRLQKNLTIVFSTWGNWIPDNPHNLPMSWVEFKKDEAANKYIPNNCKECSGYCGACANTKCSCWNLKKGENVRFHEH